MLFGNLDLLDGAIIGLLRTRLSLFPLRNPHIVLVPKEIILILIFVDALNFHHFSRLLVVLNHALLDVHIVLIHFVP